MSKKSMKRWSAKRKQEVVLRLLRGESLDALSRETRQPAAVLAGWRGDFLEAGMAGLKRRTEDPKVAALAEELKRAKRLVGDLFCQDPEQGNTIQGSTLCVYLHIAVSAVAAR